MQTGEYRTIATPWGVEKGIAGDQRRDSLTGSRGVN
jgi:hypothetical protein